jgi:hypothetical protein
VENCESTRYPLRDQYLILLAYSLILTQYILFHHCHRKCFSFGTYQQKFGIVILLGLMKFAMVLEKIQIALIPLMTGAFQ